MNKNSGFKFLISLENILKKNKVSLVFGVPEDLKSPFCSEVGLNFEERIIHYNIPSDPDDELFVVSAIIHEFGHICCSDEKPGKQSEDEFFGWEYKLSQKIGIPEKDWLESNAEYRLSISEDSEIEELMRFSQSEIVSLLNNRLDFAIEKGFLDKDFNLLYKY